MNLQQAINNLEFHQLWRLGEIEEQPITPKELTDSINFILTFLKSQNGL